MLRRDVDVLAASRPQRDQHRHRRIGAGMRVRLRNGNSHGRFAGGAGHEQKTGGGPDRQITGRVSRFWPIASERRDRYVHEMRMARGDLPRGERQLFGGVVRSGSIAPASLGSTWSSLLPRV